MSVLSLTLTRLKLEFYANYLACYVIAQKTTELRWHSTNNVENEYKYIYKQRLKIISDTTQQNV